MTATEIIDMGNTFNQEGLWLTQMIEGGHIQRFRLPEFSTLTTDYYPCTGGHIYVERAVDGAVKLREIVPTSIVHLWAGHTSSIKACAEIGEIRAANGPTRLSCKSINNPSVIDCINLYRESKGQAPLGYQNITNSFINGLSQTGSWAN